MAVEEGDNYLQGVEDFLDKEFGENLDELNDLLHLIEKKSRYQDILRNKISHCTKSVQVNKEKAKCAGKEQAAEVERLLDSKNETELEVSHYLKKNDDFIGNLKQLNQSIEEVNCVQVYLSWLTQVIHMSSELKNELSSGHLEIAVEYFNNISDVSRQTSDSKCENLVDYMITLKDYWFNVLSDVLIKEIGGLLEKMKWPFPTGISSPMMSEKTDEEIMSKFTVVSRLILKINSKYFSLTPNGNADNSITKTRLQKCLLLTEVLVKPLQKRFSYHFYGTRRTNNLEKPEWYFTQILNWIRDHSPFLETYVQSIVDNEGLQSHCIQHEFIKLLVEAASEKVKQSLPQLMTNDVLFSHMVDEVVLFDNELYAMFDYPNSFPGCTSVIMMQPYLDHWIYLEEKCGIETINNLLSQNDAFASKFVDFGIISNSKVPYSVENAVTLISLITDKYRAFKDVEAQLKFVDLQLHLLAYLTSRLQDLGLLESTVCDHKVLFAVLNGCQFLGDVLHEWTEDVFFIKLHCVKSQVESKGFSNRLQLGNARLDDSVTEDYNDVSEDIVADQESSYLESGLFDDVINSIANMTASLMEKALKSVERDFVKSLAAYKDERWHCMPSSQDVIKFMLPSSACALFMAVKELLRMMHTELYSSAFTKLWQKYARMVDSHIFDELILANHFNEGGASQLNFDLRKNLFVLFEEYTSKPEDFFKLTMESCILLNLLPGSAVLLQEVLMKSPMDNAESKHYLDAVSSLFEIGVTNISPKCALQILKSRIDWPKIK